MCVCLCLWIQTGVGILNSYISFSLKQKKTPPPPFTAQPLRGNFGSTPGDTWLPRWISGKEFTCQYRRLGRSGFDPWVRKIPWWRKWQPTPVVLPGESREQRTLAGHSPIRSQRVGRDWALAMWGNTWRHFLIVITAQCCHWYLVVRGQRWYQTFYNL